MAWDKLKAIAVGLIACLLLLSGSFFYQVPSHIVHHAHHNAATHGSVLCSWMCTTAELLDTFDVSFEIHFLPIKDTKIFIEIAPLQIPPSYFLSRAPPYLSA